MKDNIRKNIKIVINSKLTIVINVNTSQNKTLIKHKDIIADRSF